jgi:hypothetical protein
MALDKIYYYWFNRGLRTEENLDFIKITVGSNKFTIDFGNRHVNVKRHFHNPDIVTKIREYFKSQPLQGTSPSEEIQRLDGHQEFIVYNGIKIYETFPNNALIEYFKFMVNSTLNHDFETMAYRTMDWLNSEITLEY